MTDPGLTVLRPTNEAKDELCKVFNHIREQAECSNWTDFIHLMRKESGLEVSRGQFDTIAQGTYKFLKPAPIFAIHGWSRKRIFRFPNGEIMNASTLGDVVLGFRNANGDLIPGD